MAIRSHHIDIFQQLFFFYKLKFVLNIKIKSILKNDFNLNIERHNN